MESKQVQLATLCGGAVEEVFQREMREVLKNIGDPNTDPEVKRKITLEFTLAPFKDRSCAQMTFSCRSKMASVKSIEETIFLQRKGAELVALTYDPKQTRLFNYENSPDADERKREKN